MSMLTMQAMVLLSGFAGLLYQVVWQKYLTIFLGSGASATSLILAGIFLFLSLGYHFFGRLAGRLQTSRLLIYAYLELGIGAFALVSPQAFAVLKHLYWESSWLNYPLASGFVLTSICVGLPAFLMGGTIPVLAEGLSRDKEASHQVHARVYFLNTLGAFLGALITTFYLIEKFGLPTTLLLGSVINIFVFFVSWLASKGIGTPLFNSEARVEVATKELSTRDRNLVLGVSFLSGFYVFGFESLIIRMGGVALGSSVYTYGLVVAAFIAAIALGSHLAERLDTGRHPLVLMRVQIALLLSASLLYFAIPHWPDLFWRIRILFNPALMNFAFAQALTGLVLALMLVVPVALMGMSLPLLFGFLRHGQFKIARLVGQLYSVNCMGAVLGALIGGYGALYFFSSAQVFRLNLVLVALGAVALMALLKIRAATWATLAAFSLLALPDWDWKNFLPARAYLFNPVSPIESSFKSHRAGTLLGKIEFEFHQEDPSLTASVVRSEVTKPDGTKVNDTGLYLNGKADAVYPADEGVRAMLALLTSSLVTKAERSAIVGLGAGLSLGILANIESMKQVDVVEISPSVIKALPHFEKFIPGLKENQSKANLQVGDAFQVLRRQNEKYDLILCEPTNLWIVGVDKLYTSDFFELVASRLSAEGVFALWVPFAGMSADSFSLVLTTLQAVFPYVTLWNSGSGTVSAVGSLKPLTRPPDLVLAERFSDNRTIFERLKIKHPATLLGLQIATPWMVNGLGAKDIRVHTVEYPVLTYASARTLFIRDGTNYDSFWSDRLLRPGPSEDPTHQFLADQSEFTPEVLQDITDYYKNQGRMTSRIFEYKYLYRAKKAGQAVNGKTEAQAVAALRAVVDKVPLVVGGKSEEALRYKTQLLLTAYQRARLAGLKPHMEAVFHEYNWQCETWACAKLAQALLAEFLPLDQAKPYRGAMDLTSLEKRRALQRTLGDFARSINALAGN